MTREKLFVEKSTLTLAAAQRAATAAQAEAERNGWPVVIAMVDDGANLLLLHRLDGAQFGSVEIATRKARAAVAFKRPTKAWEESLKGGRQGVLALPGVMPAEGGVPILRDGQIVGAIGVSGVLPNQDGQIAQAGAAALGS